jgi:large subunit ribosomal protein L35
MPKMKSNSGAKKRFRVTKNGKVIAARGFKRHILEKKSAKRKRSLRGVCAISEPEAARVKRMLPYA